MKFSPAYSQAVLSDNFEDAKRLFLEYLLDLHFVHLIMLHRIGILSREEARVLVGGLEKIDLDRIRTQGFDGDFEDLFFFLEKVLEETCGPEAVGKLHTARSRNDVAVTLYRLRWREAVLEVLLHAHELRRVLLVTAERHCETLLPIHTHTQPAQPSTLAHYLLGLVEHLERDHRRVKAALESLNTCPLGSCAVTGTGFPVDRKLLSRLLEFDAPTGNTHGSIASVDYILEPVSSLMVLLTGLGKFVQDLLIWTMAEFGYLSLDDGLVQRSSIMPQKRNPVAIEHVRSLAGKALGQASGVFLMLHNTPHGDIVDVEDDLQPLLFSVFRDTVRALGLLAASLEGARFDPKRLCERAGENWLTLTELADTLVRRQGLPFRTAHSLTSVLMQRSTAEPERPLGRLLAELSRELLGKSIEYTEKDLERILSPEHFIEVRRTPGGPAPTETQREVALKQKQAARDVEGLKGWNLRFSEYRKRLRDEAARL